MNDTLEIRKPMLKSWYKLAQTNDQLLLEYGSHRVSFKGEGIKSFLPRLLTVLDGTRSVEEVQAAMGADSAPAVSLTLETLNKHGLLIDADGCLTGLPEKMPQTAAYLIATGYATDFASIRQLAAMQIGILGAGTVASQLAVMLRQSGIEQVKHLDWTQNITDVEEMNLIIAAPTGSELINMDSWNSTALKASTEWFALLPFDGRYATVGPLFIPSQTACWHCFKTRRWSHLDYPMEAELTSNIPVDLPSNTALDAILAGMAATSVLPWLLNRDNILPGFFQAVIPGAHLKVTDHEVFRIPRCQACSRLTGNPRPWYEVART